VTETKVGILVRLRLAFFRTTLRSSVPADLYFGLGADALVTTETVHLSAAASDDDAQGFVPEGPESVI